MKWSKKSLIIQSVISFVIGTILLIAILPAFTATEEVCIDAQITEIIEQTDESGRTKYDVFIEYQTEDGIKEKQLEEYTPDMKENDWIEIDCKTERKYDWIKDGLLGTTIFMIIFYLIGILILTKVIMRRKKEKMEKTIMQTGMQVVSKIIEIKKKKNKYQIICQWIDPNNKEYHFISKRLKFNPTKLLKKNNITALYTKINEKNPKQYVVETEYLEQLRKKELEDWQITFRQFEMKEITQEEYLERRKEVFEEE